ncbi:MAG TPA: hypothetical protein ENJ82_04295 [Bacteroidetes bacterium]|nr:hypothetical protein [Bacteroidota bacterium]
MTFQHVSIGNSFNGHGLSYIYLVLSRSFRILYVGQTNDRIGTIGRLRGHLSVGGTFRKHFEEAIGEPLESVLDLELISFPLGRDPIFISEESAYREGVEFLVRKFLMQKLATRDTFFRFVGRVHPSSTSRLSHIISIAKSISETGTSAICKI